MSLTFVLNAVNLHIFRPIFYRNWNGWLAPADPAPDLAHGILGCPNLLHNGAGVLRKLSVGDHRGDVSPGSLAMLRGGSVRNGRSHHLHLLFRTVASVLWIHEVEEGRAVRQSLHSRHYYSGPLCRVAVILLFGENNSHIHYFFKKVYLEFVSNCWYSIYISMCLQWRIKTSWCPGRLKTRPQKRWVRVSVKIGYIEEKFR